MEFPHCHRRDLGKKSPFHRAGEKGGTRWRSTHPGPDCGLLTTSLVLQAGARSRLTVAGGRRWWEMCVGDADNSPPFQLRPWASC